MPIINDRDILNYLYRNKYQNGTYYFGDLIREAILYEMAPKIIEAEALADTILNKCWSTFVRDYDEDNKFNIVPLFDIIDSPSKTVQWIGTKAANISSHKRYLYFQRPDLYKYIDSINDRQYEALACVLCEILGADKVLLTNPGNEGGIDFIARIKFSRYSHFLFGVKGPVRIIGQCKKYKNKDNIGHMKEFVQTLNNVYNLSYRPGEILPDWFTSFRGPILGWHIANLGHQSGAQNMAKNYGILISSTKDIIDLICNSKIPTSYGTFSSKVEGLKFGIKKYITLV